MTRSTTRIANDIILIFRLIGLKLEVEDQSTIRRDSIRYITNDVVIISLFFLRFIKESLPTPLRNCISDRSDAAMNCGIRALHFLTKPFREHPVVTWGALSIPCSVAWFFLWRDPTANPTEGENGAHSTRGTRTISLVIIV